MNTELFKKIHESSTAGELGMRTWESTNDCGTTRCMAGWAIHHTTGQPLKETLARKHQSVLDLAEKLDVLANFEDIGAKLLGLTRDEAGGAFYLQDEEGAEFIRLAAEGRDEEARQYLREAWGDE